MTYEATPEIECTTCGGYGFIPPASRMGSFEDCADCEGSGLRPMTQDELNDEAEADEERRQSAYAPSLDEQHIAAWHQKNGESV